MQFIEASYAAVRSAVYRLRRPGSGLEFQLFPMIHVGSSAYYAEVAARLRDCDLILAEGVGGRRTTFLTSWYRLVEHTSKLGLVTQRALDLRALGPTVINADFSGDQFPAGWRRLPLGERVLLYLAVPVIAGFLYLFGTRQLLAEHCQVEDLPSRREILRHGDVLPGFERLIVDHRDAHLLRVIEETCEKAGSENMRVAIVYGARHMRAVTRLLMGKLGYRVLDAEWIIVFDV